MNNRNLSYAIIQECWKSDSFKQKLISNPQQVLQERYNYNLGEDYNNIVVEDQSSENTLFINIPSKKIVDTLELTDEELEGVSGGDFTLGLAIALTFVAYEIYQGYQCYQNENP